MTGDFSMDGTKFSSSTLTKCSYNKKPSKNHNYAVLCLVKIAIPLAILDFGDAVEGLKDGPGISKIKIIIHKVLSVLLSCLN